MKGADSEILRALMLDLNSQVEPLHEWAAGQRAYFEGQGYNPEEARAMAAAEFVTVFGTLIPRRDGTPS